MPKLANGEIYKKSSAKYMMSIMIAVIILPAFINNLIAKIFATTLILVIYVAVSWKLLLGAQEKRFIAEKLGWNSN